MSTPLSLAIDITTEVINEIHNAEKKHGAQLDLPMFHPFGHDMPSGNLAKIVCQARSAHGDVTWADIFQEEVGEAYDETDDMVALRAELIQVAAMAIAWIRALDHQQVTT